MNVYIYYYIFPFALGKSTVKSSDVVSTQPLLNPVADFSEMYLFPL